MHDGLAIANDRSILQSISDWGLGKGERGMKLGLEAHASVAVAVLKLEPNIDYYYHAI